MPHPTPTPIRTAPGQPVLVEVAGQSAYLVPGHRLVVGSSVGCDLVATGAGISRHHVRLGLRPDGSILVRPLKGSPVRSERRRNQHSFVILPGEQVGLGLVALTTSPVEHNLYVQARIALSETWLAARQGIRRSPSFLFSAAFHALIFLLLMPIVVDRASGEGNAKSLDLIGLTDVDAKSELDLDSEEEELDLVEVEDPTPPEPELDPVAEPDLPDLAPEMQTGIASASDKALLSEYAFERIARKPSKPGDGDGRRAKHAAPLPSGLGRKFVKTVSRLRETGFEIALAFDSTSSMGGTLRDAKEEILQILLLLEKLVPDSRIALVTYRDEGDAYVTKGTELGIGRYEARSFLSSIRPGGGGDFPEAGELDWRKETSKALVLVGDAPPHRGNRTRRALRLARSFRSRRGRVHGLYVSQNDETVAAFEKIAKAGGGGSFALSQSDALARQILEASFGSKGSGDIDQLIRLDYGGSAAILEADRGKRPPLAAVVATLRRRTPDPVLVEPYARSSAGDFAKLLRACSGKRLSREGHHALFYLVNRLLERRNFPPIAPTAWSASRALPEALAKATRWLLRGTRGRGR